MRPRQAAFIFAVLCLTVACSPRDFLTRRLATDLIAGSETFKMTQLFWLRTGVISNKDYTSPEYLVLRRHGWITGHGCRLQRRSWSGAMLGCGDHAAGS